MTTLKILQAAVEYTKAAHSKALCELSDFQELPENNVFGDLDTAIAVVKNNMLNKAHDACEGSHCFGESKYTQEFSAAGQKYLGVLEVDYNRHDKTYYFVDSDKFSYTKI